MFGSCRISSKREMAFEAFTAAVYSLVCNAFIASFADRLIFLGVVLSSETSESTAKACLILYSYSSAFFFRTINCHLPHLAVAKLYKL
jgi:hypothetical protein